MSLSALQRSLHRENRSRRLHSLTSRCCRSPSVRRVRAAPDRQADETATYWWLLALEFWMCVASEVVHSNARLLPRALRAGVAKLDRLSRDVDFISGLMVHRVAVLVAELGTERRPVHAPHLCRPGATGTSYDSRPHSCVARRRAAQSPAQAARHRPGHRTAPNPGQRLGERREHQDARRCPRLS
jgi:hypothetical protein